ncbi:nicotinate phosphoribosyltransferase pncB2 [Candidatus Mycoplasma haematohominis]|uniref:nicotinate phosphoribosyltransferase n=1 Tax=Candidatus Mycoplasma haematohominis TaxID=1494318 RepID=A0A478FPT4_9MOLU|nr:nicotinate phosphoribosyltransferase pncB2 [Candidatus Mycoplasma haemohominis]
MNKFVSEYFFRARDIVGRFNGDNEVVLQFFQREKNAVLSGINEALELLKEKLSGTSTVIRYLPEGTIVQPKEVVLELEGRYQDFGIYEGIIDGILARATSIATNSYRCIQAAKGKEIICMSDRSDHYSNQVRDGHSMYVGGIRSFSSYSQVPEGKESECVVYGSIPHALIQNFRGDLIQVMEHYHELFPDEDLVALVDFHNDVIGDSLRVLDKLGSKLKGVRVDTSSFVKDVMFDNDSKEYGVTPLQIKNLRETLDRYPNGKDVRIYVSSGFNPERISYFEEQNTPVDGYGVGEALLKINNTFCADAVKLNGEEIAKFGRFYRANENLIEYKCQK